MADNKQTGGNLPAKGPGRPKGSPNKTTALLKDALLEAATKAGGKAGLVGYLQKQADENSGPFMALLGKVLPLQLSSDPDAPFEIQVIERRVVHADNRDR